MSKTLTFDATKVETSARGAYVYLEVTAACPNEVLENFSPKEIMESYGESNLEDLYELLQIKFD